MVPKKTIAALRDHIATRNLRGQPLDLCEGGQQNLIPLGINQVQGKAVAARSTRMRAAARTRSVGGQINGTTATGHNVNRVGVGTGVYSLGAPRQIEFGLRLTF